MLRRQKTHYDDPLVERVYKRTHKSHTWLHILVVVLIAWILYREVVPWILSGERPGRDKGVELTSRPAVSSESFEGAYQLRWAEGEQQLFGLSATVEGKGSPALTGTTGMKMGFDADLAVGVDYVDEQRTMSVAVAYADAIMYGNFFGYPVDLRRFNGVTQSYARTDIAPPPTAANKKFDPPGPEVFEEPIYGEVGPDGVPAQPADTRTRFNQFVATIIRVSGPQFPQSDLRVGDTWEEETEFALVGLGRPVPVRIKTELVEEGVYGGRTCGHLVRTIIPLEKRRGPLAKLAHFAVTGDVSIYFDINAGKTAYSEASLEFDLVLGDSLQEAADLLGVYSGLLDELEGGPSFDLAGSIEEGPSEPIGLRVRTVAALKQGAPI
jgi:hypothetical protein